MIEEVLDDLSTFSDYVIVGGGTAGLALAVLLSANPSTSVIVLEAGLAHDDHDPVINSCELSADVFGIPKYTYAFLTSSESNAKGDRSPWFRGKGLGGTSLINFQGWVTPPSQDLDATEALGNPGWGWNDYVKYQKRSSAKIKKASVYYSEVLDRMLLDTLTNLGIEENLDPFNGNTVGCAPLLNSLDPQTFTRSSSTTAYYNPVRDRSNLTVITEATVARVLFDSTNDGDLTAIGAEFIHNGKTRIARSNKEVILSAGTLRSPQLLELSGIGRRDVIYKIGVELKVELPGVGENMQEHIQVAVLYEIASEIPFETTECLQDPVYLEERRKRVAEGRGGTLGVRPGRITYFPLTTVNPEGAAEVIKNVEEEVEALKKSGTLPPGRAEQYDLQLKTLRDPKAPDCQIFLLPGLSVVKVSPVPGKRYVTLAYIGNHLFSRGSIHAKSSDPNEQSEMVPRYLTVEYDLELMKQQMAFGRKMLAQEPLKSACLKQVYPEPGISDADYIKEALNTTWHTVGSCSMMPREKNGVVSPELVVYGTKNLRVVDLSVIPLHLATHTQSVAYAIAEKAADLILGLQYG